MIVGSALFDVFSSFLGRGHMGERSQWRGCAANAAVNATRGERIEA